MKSSVYPPIDQLADEAIDYDLLTEGRKPDSEMEETERYDSLNGALACLVKNFYMSGIDTQEEHPRLL